MKKTYYVESKKNFENDLAVLNEQLDEMSSEIRDTLIGLLGKLGFDYDDYDGKRFSMPAVYSVWDVRAYSKKLVVKKDLVNFIENNTSLDMDEFSEKDIENAVDVIASHPNYGDHLHQADYILITGVEYLENLLDDEDNECGCDNCNGCTRTGKKEADDHIGAAIVFSTIKSMAEQEKQEHPKKSDKRKEELMQAFSDLIDSLAD